MKDAIQYRPFRSEAWFVPFTLGIGILAFTATGYCLPNIESTVFFLVFGILCFWLTKKLYDTSNMIVSFEWEGVRITGGKFDNYCYASWEEMEYAYYARNFKGHLFLVLSPKALSEKQVKQFVNRAVNSYKLCVDFVIVIHIDAMQDVSQIKERISSKVSNIQKF